VLSEALIAIGLLEGSVDEVVEHEKYKRFYMHRTSHWLGRDVHDVGQYKIGDTPRALEPGMVFTVEPGLYVPADADDVAPPYRGIGIRIEDDVLVTARRRGAVGRRAEAGRGDETPRAAAQA
jgi:Xaa-Pro aminopeptidase